MIQTIASSHSGKAREEGRTFGLASGYNERNPELQDVDLLGLL